jgi:hypothetical protein
LQSVELIDLGLGIHGGEVYRYDLFIAEETRGSPRSWVGDVFG